MKMMRAKRLTTVSPLIVIVAILCGILIWRMNGSGSADSASPSGSNSRSLSPVETASEPVNMQKLVGRWLRTDSPYEIEIREVGPDGTLRAGYYNPRSINVAVAKVEDKDGMLRVFVELNDAGYPGSNYTLNYDLQNDVLEGTYFQATLKQNFDVVFVRMPAEH